MILKIVKWILIVIGLLVVLNWFGVDLLGDDTTEPKETPEEPKPTNEQPEENPEPVPESNTTSNETT